MPSQEAIELARIADSLELIQPDIETIKDTLILVLAAVIRVAAVEENMAKCIDTGGKRSDLDRKGQPGLVNYVYTNDRRPARR